MFILKDNEITNSISLKPIYRLNRSNAKFDVALKLAQTVNAEKPEKEIGNRQQSQRFNENGNYFTCMGAFSDRTFCNETTKPIDENTRSVLALGVINTTISKRNYWNSFFLFLW